MAHHTARSGYRRLIKRLNRYPQGAPPSEVLYKILGLLFSEKEASLVALLPIKPFTVDSAARAWKMSLAESQNILDALSGRAILIDIAGRKKRYYVLPPPMAGFFEFSMMRIRGDIDQKLLAELYHQYITVEEDFIKSLFTQGETQLGRAFVHEPVLSSENALHVMDYERAGQVVKSASHRGVGICYCRHKMRHLGRVCSAPLDICLTFNATAASLIRHGFARAVDASEGLSLLQQAYDHNLVQFGENVRSRVGFICNCCACCCEAMIAARRFGILHPVHTTNFILDEVYTYFARYHEVAVQMARLIMENPIIMLHRVGADDEEAAWGILNSFSDKAFSYTDATSFAVMEKLGLTTAFAFDVHYQQYGRFKIVP